MPAIPRDYKPYCRWEGIDLKAAFDEIDTGSLNKDYTLMLACPNCDVCFSHDSRYDVNMDEVVSCPRCNWTVSKWCFEYVSETPSVHDPKEEENA